MFPVDVDCNCRSIQSAYDMLPHEVYPRTQECPTDITL